MGKAIAQQVLGARYVKMKQKFSLLMILIFSLILIACGGVAGVEVETDKPAVSNTESALPTGSGILSVGDLPYEFSLEDINGETVTLSELRGRPVIVNFWASWCGPCRIEMPHLQDAFETYMGDDLVILAVNQGETADVASEFFIDEMGLTFDLILDPDETVPNAYGTRGTLPATFFLNADLEIVAIHRGPMTLGQIDGYMEDILGDG